MIQLLYFVTLFSITFSQTLPSEVKKIKTEIQIDGIAEEEDWAFATNNENFYQLKPRLGDAATEKTSVLFLYDNEHIYVYAKMNYSNKSQIYAITKERDQSLELEDYIEIHIDSKNDHSSTRIFRVNLFSTREDYQSNLNGEVLNHAWNTFWDVKSIKTENTWAAEFKIPFASLQFQADDENIMRIKTVFNYSRKNEQIISDLNNKERTPLIYLYENSREYLFKNISSSKPLFISPYLKASALRSSKINASSSKYNYASHIFEENGFFPNPTADKIFSNIGLDLRYQFDSNKSISLTLNTDFAQAESDDQIINVTRFPVSLQEKRQFFLEDANLFNSNQFDHRLFHSRRIGINNGKKVPIIAGLRYISSNDQWQSGVLSLQSQSIKNESLPSNSISIARTKYLIDRKGSYIGFLASSKLSENDYNYLAALDGNFRFGNNKRSRFTLATTFDKEKGNWKPMYGMSVTTFKSNGFGFQYRYRDYSENFNPELAFLSRPNTKRMTLNHAYRKNLKNSQLIERISIGHYLTNSWVSSNKQKDLFQTNFYMILSLSNGMSFRLLGPIYQKDYLSKAWDFNDNINIPVSDYEMLKVETSISTENAFPIKLDIDTEIGEFYGGQQLSYTAQLLFNINDQLSSEIGMNQNHLKFPKSFVKNNKSTVTISRYFNRLKYAISDAFFINSYIQYDNKSEQIAWNIRLRYTDEEASNFYLVYNQIQNQNLNSKPILLPIANQSILLKYSQTFTF